jgi:hypothetical protein
MTCKYLVILARVGLLAGFKFSKHAETAISIIHF